MVMLEQKSGQVITQHAVKGLASQLDREVVFRFRPVEYHYKHLRRKRLQLGHGYYWSERIELTSH